LRSENNLFCSFVETIWMCMCVCVQWTELMIIIEIIWKSVLIHWIDMIYQTSPFSFFDWYANEYEFLSIFYYFFLEIKSCRNDQTILSSFFIQYIKWKLFYSLNRHSINVCFHFVCKKKKRHVCGYEFYVHTHTHLNKLMSVTPHSS
jgi:hypothetical protein